MASNSDIEWTDATWNPVSGCTRVSAGCDHCYAKDLTWRWEHSRFPQVRARYAGLTVLNGRGERHFNGQVRTHEDVLAVPLRWRKPRRIFVNSMSDLFHPAVPFAFIDRVFAVMALTPQHTYQILTKRPERMAEWLARVDSTLHPNTQLKVGGYACWLFKHLGVGIGRGDVLSWPLRNVWLGTSIENQATADARIPELLKCPAAVRFVSVEPLLGAIDLGPWLGRWTCNGEAGVGAHDGKGGPGSYCGSICRDFGKSLGPLDWVIVGGESGPGARPMHPDWSRGIRDQCAASGVPFFFKQWGEFLPLNDWRRLPPDPDGPTVETMPRERIRIVSPYGIDDDRAGTHYEMVRVGKKAAGRTLDGKTYDEFPARQPERTPRVQGGLPTSTAAR